MKKVKKGILIVLTILLVIVATINIYTFICIKVIGKPIATINGYGMLEVVSGSMEPTIHVGDFVIINTKAKEYKVGDIVTFYDNEGSFVTHKIISIDNDSMITKGDNNTSVDGVVPTKDIVGKYVTKITSGGKIMAALKSPFTLIMILVIGILVCIFISTDKEGNPIITEEEKEFQEFLEQKNKSQETVKKKSSKKKAIAVSKSTSNKKSANKKTITKKK